MNLRPVIERELRVAARQRGTYFGRLAPGLILTVILGAMLFTLPGGMPAYQQGHTIFNVLSVLLFFLIWLIVPLTTADSLSREKREDTLGLLLLTPLRPLELVISKLFSGFWQSGMLILVVVPIMAIPVLVGGVTFLDLLRQVVTLVLLLISAVTVGIVASSLCEHRGRAWVTMIFVGGVWIYLQLYLHGLLWMFEWGRVNPNANPFMLFSHQPGEKLIVPVFYGFSLEAGISQDMVLGTFQGTNNSELLVGFWMLGITLLASVLCVGFATRRVRRFGEARFLSARQEKVRKVFTSERFGKAFLKRSRHRLLNQNPIAWMQERRWSHRLVKWSWLLAATTVISLASLDQGYAFMDTAIMTSAWIGVFMLFSLLLVSASSLQNERDSGALELLLVTPLTPRELVAGRIRTFRKSFIPAALMVAMPFLYFSWLQFTLRSANYFPPNYWIWFSAEIVSLIGFFALLLWWMPAIGLCFSLHRPGVLAAALNTVFFAVIIPWLLPISLVGMGYGSHEELHTRPEDRVAAFWIWPATWVAVTAVIQFAIWRTVRKSSAIFPPLMPDWFRRWKLGWILPWVLPLMSFAWFEFLDPLLPQSVQSSDDEWTFALWHLTAWCLLIFLSRRCRLALIQMLADRSFVRSSSAA